MNTRIRTLAAVAALALVAVAASAIATRSGEAHADYDRSVPAADSVVDTAPAIVEIWFTQEIGSGGTVVRVLGPDGAQVDLGDTTLDLFDPERKRVTVSLQSNLAPGTYTVEWTTLSAEDGESGSGTFAFTIAGAAATPSASPEASPVASPAASPAAN